MTIASRRAKIAKAGFGLSMTHGTSMRPLIWGGRHCVAVVALNGEPNVGDLLMFAQRRVEGEINIVHRLVEIKRAPEGGGPLYVTRGDNCLESETVRPEEIIGRVAEVHRTGGFRPWHAIWAKRFGVTDRSYRLYTCVWTAIWPVRSFYYRLRVRYWAIRGRVKSIFSKER